MRTCTIRNMPLYILEMYKNILEMYMNILEMYKDIREMYKDGEEMYMLLLENLPKFSVYIANLTHFFSLFSFKLISSSMIHMLVRNFSIQNTQ